MNNPNGLLNLFDIMQNEIKTDWIQFITTNKLLKIWRHAIPLIKLLGDVNRVLLSIYEESNFYDIEIYALIRLWDDLTSHLEEIGPNNNVEVTEWFELLKNTPPDCFGHTVFTEKLGNLLINTLLVCVSEGIEV